MAALDGHLTTVDLHPEQVVAQPGDDIRRVYFPHSGIVSFMVVVADGDVVQTGMVGRDGVIGAAQAIDDKVSINKIIVQIAATATMIDRDHLREAMRDGSAIRKVLASHEQFFVADIQQPQPAMLAFSGSADVPLDAAHDGFGRNRLASHSGLSCGNDWGRALNCFGRRGPPAK